MHRNSFIFSPVIAIILLGLGIPLHAQTLTHSIQVESVKKFLTQAEGLKLTDDGQLWISSSHQGAVLVYDKADFNTIFLSPGIFKDTDVSGIDQLDDGRVVIANEGSGQVAVLKESFTEAIKVFAQSGGDAGELNEPRALVISTNNRIYLADRDNNRISVFNDQGLFLRQIGHHDRDESDLSKPTHIALDANENVYVLESGERNRVSIFTRRGDLIKQLDTKKLSQQFGSNIDFSAMTTDLNGVLYLADDNNKQIFSYDWQRDRILNRFGALGLSRGQYRSINQLSINKNGQLAVLDRINGKVEIYQLETTRFKKPVKNDVVRLASVRQNNCRSVHAFINHKTLCIKADESGIVILSKQGEQEGVFAPDIQNPTTLHSGSSMVAILEKNMLHTYTHSGEKIYSVGRFGTSAGGFDHPRHVFSAHNRIYVADSGNNRIQIFQRDGQFAGIIKGGSDSTFNAVGPLVVDSEQNVYIAEEDGSGLIRMLDKKGQRITSIGHQQPTSHRARKIHALDIDQQDRLYALVSSAINDYNIRIFEKLTQVMEFGTGHENASQLYFDKPSSLSIVSGATNEILINDSKLNKLFRFNMLEYPDTAFALQVNADRKQVELVWNSSKSPLIEAYEIQVSDREEGPYEKLAVTKDLNKIFNADDLLNKTWFRIQTISGFGLRAKPSAARENQFVKLQGLFNKTRYEEVIALADRLLNFSPHNADVLQLKAESELASGQHLAALASFKKLALYPAYKSLAIHQQVKAYYELKQYLEAKALIEEVLASQTGELYPYLVCTELSLLLNDAIGAVTCAEDGIAMYPQHARLRFLLGKSYILAGLLTEGLNEYTTLIKDHPQNHELRLAVAHHMMELNRFENALSHFESLAGVESVYSRALIGQANALLKLNRDEEAKAIAIKLSTNKQTRGDGYYVLGKVAAKQGKYTEAVLRLTRAGKDNPHNTDVWLSLAQAYTELQQLDKAVSSLQQGIEHNAEAFPLYVLAGKLELQLDRFTSAKEYLDQAIRLNAQSVEANTLYARSFYATRNYYSAAIYAEKAAKIAPKNIDVLSLQADIASQQGKAGTAIEYLKTAINLDPASADLQYRLGKVYQQANLFDNATIHLDKAAAIDPSWAQPHIALGQLYAKRRLFDQAIAAFEQAIKLDPSDYHRALLNTTYAQKKKSLEFKSNAPQLVLTDLNLKHVFSAAYKKYADQSIGTVTLQNVAATDYGNLQLSFQIKEYMDFPLIQEIPLIKGNSSQTFDFKATFNNKILEVDEDIGVQVEVKLSYNRDGKTDSIRLTQPMTIYGKNAMVWGDPLMVGSFVTPKDDTLRNYVRTVINEFQPQVGPLNDRLVSAMTLFSSLTAAGTKYIIDPITPYNSLRDDQVDYVQFPRETLRLKSGDCDDLSVLLSAGLESLGIETVLLEVPGHLLLMFNSGLDEKDAGLISLDNSLMAFRNGQVWLPLEATMINASFNEAWAEGARKYHKAQQEENLGIIDLKKAWASYRPVTLQKSGFSIDLPDKNLATKLIKIAQDQLLVKSINRLVLPYQSMITNDPTNIQARMQIGILYSRYGLYEDAQLVFDALHELAPEDSAVHANQGNLYLLRKQYDAAISSYEQAIKLDDKDGGIWVNLSMAKYRKGDLSAAANDFQRAIQLTPELKNTYAAYQKLLSQ